MAGSLPMTAAVIKVTTPEASPRSPPPGAPKKMPASTMGIRLKFSVMPNIGTALAKSCSTTTSARSTAKYAMFLAVKKEVFFMTITSIEFFRDRKIPAEKM